MTLRLELSQETNPYGVRPCGNLFMAPRVQDEEDEDGAPIAKKRAYTSEELRAHGLGPSLRRLEDETLAMEVLGALDGQDLARYDITTRPRIIHYMHGDWGRAKDAKWHDGNMSAGFVGLDHRATCTCVVYLLYRPFSCCVAPCPLLSE